MELVKRSIVPIVLLYLSLLVLTSQTTSTTRALDAILQDYAFRAFFNVRPKTGIAYDGTPPSNLTGIQISALRLRTGSLRRRGVSAYKEFRIPRGVIEQPRVTRIVLVYHNLGNRSTVYYPLPSPYVYVAPVLGLLSYDASNLSATNLPELDLTASDRPISVQFSIPDGSIPKCVYFALNGSIIFNNIVSGNVCSAFQQGHFSVVVESAAPKKNNNRIWIIIGSVLGGLGLLILLGILALWLYKCRNKKKMQQMENAADAGEALETTSVGNTRAPLATVTRTQPSLETEYVP